jgi:hypothetical protein
MSSFNCARHHDERLNLHDEDEANLVDVLATVAALHQALQLAGFAGERRSARALEGIPNGEKNL